MHIDQWDVDCDKAYVQSLSRTLKLPASAFGEVKKVKGSVTASVEFRGPWSSAEALKSLSFEGSALEKQAFEAPIVSSVRKQGDEDALERLRGEIEAQKREVAELRAANHTLESSSSELREALGRSREELEVSTRKLEELSAQAEQKTSVDSPESSSESQAEVEQLRSRLAQTSLSIFGYFYRVFDFKGF